MRVGEKREVREGERKGEPREDVWALTELQGLVAVTSQGRLLSLFRCVLALTQRTAGKCSLNTSGVSSPVRDSHSPAALTIPGDLRQVLKLIALIWAKGIFLSNEHPHKATLGITPPFRQIPERIPLPVQLSQGDHTGAKGSDMVSIEHMSLILISFNCLEIMKK